MKDQQAIKRGAVCTALVGAWAQRRSLPAIVGLGVSLAASSLAATTPPATSYEATDLNGIVASETWACGAGGSQQVGYACYGDPSPVSVYAVLWTGSAGSAVDLHPAGFASSVAKRVHNGHQVGYGQYADLTQHALVWNGTAASVVDLHPFLPAGYPSSVATGIDAAGNVVCYAWDPHLATALGNCHSFLWKPQ